MQSPPIAARPVSGRAQRGASTAEFIVVGTTLLMLGLGGVQLGLIYHGKTILNYAAFEAARTGAVNHALAEPMVDELAVRLAPIMGGDGSVAGAAAAIVRSVAEVTSEVGIDGMTTPVTSIERLSPSTAAFEDWGVRDPLSGRTVIPNSHLRHRGSKGAEGPSSGMSLREANLLEIEVTHGLALKVPLVGSVLAKALEVVDPENAAWYRAGRMPLKSVATVRMQSDAWEEEAEPAGSAAPDGGDGQGVAVAIGGDSVVAEGTVVDADAGAEGDDGACGEHGVPEGTPVTESAFLTDCPVDGGFGRPDTVEVLFGADETDPGAADC